MSRAKLMLLVVAMTTLLSRICSLFGAITSIKEGQTILECLAFKQLNRSNIIAVSRSRHGHISQLAPEPARLRPTQQTRERTGYQHRAKRAPTLSQGQS